MVPSSGLKGKLRGPSIYGCNLIKLEPGCIAIVLRGQCSFAEKVRTMQNSGASAVIVGNNKKNQKLMHMFSADETSDIEIPSVFVTHEDYLKLLEILNRHPRVRVFITRNAFDAPFFHVFVIGFLGPGLVVGLFYFFAWVRLRYVAHIKAHQCQHALMHTPTKRFSVLEGGDQLQCMICLEDYEDQDTLRVLPCGHDFHKACLDKWVFFIDSK